MKTYKKLLYNNYILKINFLHQMFIQDRNYKNKKLTTKTVLLKQLNLVLRLFRYLNWEKKTKTKSTD